MTGRSFDSFSLPEYLDVIWAMMLRDGRGGMIDYPKYRDMLTDIIWNDKAPELTAEQQVQQTKDAVGKPMPENAMEQARALRERMNAAAEPDSD